MNKIFACIALLCLATPAVAEDNLLAKLGLSGIQTVNETQASEVYGRGFVFAYGKVTNRLEAGGLGDMFDLATSESEQDLELLGLNIVEGITGATNSINFDLSETKDDGTRIIAQGNLTVTSTTIVAGAAN